ncbi:MAG: prolyl oligopeptidase family serine peptidase [Acidobacteriota bacterium]|nr:prolyl oligopeptidase family serine peptidase [Acidobacteriota bacterium]
MRTRLLVAVAFALACLAAAAGNGRVTLHAQPADGYSAADVFSFPFPSDLTAASRAGRIIWAFNEQGRRNLWVAEAPSFDARQLTHNIEDDGQELTSVSLTAAGNWAVYVRGGDHGSNWDDSLPVNPLAMPVPPKVQVWSVPFGGGEPRLIGEGDYPVISPRGDVVAFEKDRHIWLAPIDASQPPSRIVATTGNNGSVVWSPDGSRIAFVSGRGDHAFIGIYKDAQTPIQWVAPSTSRDGMPRWSPDGTRLVFVRRPGAGGPPVLVLTPRHDPWALWVADAATGQAQELWRAPDTLRGSVPSTEGGVNLHWAANDRIVFLSYMDGWPHLYSVPAAGGEPLLLTPGDYMAEYIRLSPDGTHLVFAANAGSTVDDIDRRHIVRVPVDRAEAQVLTPGTGLEWTPVVTGDLAHIAFLGATAQRPPLPAVMPAAGGPARRVAEDRLPGRFPTSRLVTPRAVRYTASDGVVVHGQLFEPPAGAAPGRRPAIVYVHGGPPRQMLLGWHYSDYYARAYASNQYLASRGFLVLSINYRLGIGYGYEFHRPPAAGAQGASEYLDVRAAAEYLKTLPQTDGARIGIYGGSYGGYLTALALARNSDLFATGVDIHGVHDFTTSGSGAGAQFQAALAAGARPEPSDRQRAIEVAWQSSPASSIAMWKSPVLLIHGDEDRNVRFNQTVDLVRRLDEAGVTYEELVIPDDTHHWMRHANVLKVYQATADWFERRFLAATPSMHR